MTKPTKATLRPALAWTCEECGRDNFLNGVIDESRPLEGPDEFFMMMPDRVTCAFCGKNFETADPMEGF